MSAEDVFLFLAQIRGRYPNSGTSLILFCNVGIRSSAAGHALTSAGYTNVMTVKDGFLGNRFGRGLQTELF